MTEIEIIVSDICEEFMLTDYEIVGDVSDFLLS